MGVFRAVFGRRGDGSFSDLLLGVSSGVVGFNAAMFLRAVRDICRPARPDAGASVSAKKFAMRAKNAPKLAFSDVLGEFFRGNAAEGAVWGEFFADQQSWDPAGRVCCAVRQAAGPIYWHPDPSHHLSGMRAN